MTDQQIPAGWYTDPSGAAQLRWWDGTAWTAHVAPAAPAQPTAGGSAASAPYRMEPAMLPESTPVYTRWIWWIVWLPVISLVFATGYLVAVGNATVGMVSSLPMTTDPSTMSPQKDALSAQAVVSVLPWMFAIIPVGWGLTAVIVWFAYLDWRDLGRLGYARRFHWAWSFLGIVYPIGRSVVVKRQTGRGSGPMWASIWIEAGWFVIVIGWSIWLTIAFMQAAVERAGQVTGY